MSTDSVTVVLFDIDGTLLRTEGVSRHSRAFRTAFEKVFGTECRFSRGMHGMTDMQIFISLAREMGLGDGQIRVLARDACRTMVELYKVPGEGDGSYVALPGVREVLEALSGRGVVLGLLTGNAPEIAQDKLASVGLDRFFAFGAFGTEGEDRTALPPIAIARAEALIGSAVNTRRVFVIGDTPRDVACALDNGCRAVAVATGFVPVTDLQASGAELVLPDLTDLAPLLRVMDLLPPPSHPLEERVGVKE